MTYIETSFEIDTNSKISSLIWWKKFRSDKEFLETLEDFAFWNIIKKWDKWDYVNEEEIFKELGKNICK